MKLLIAEDEAAMLEAIADTLTYQQYEIVTASNGIEALEKAENACLDGLVLDIMMPGMDGLTVLRALRRQGNQTPILLLTAKGEIEERVAGLDAGADDYLTKPFAMSELLARIRVMTRRQQRSTSQLSLGHVSLDEDTGLLLMEKMDEQLLKATTVPVELRALTHAAVQEVHDLFAQRGITLRMALPNELRFQGHTEALAQLLHILLDNAARYAAENTEAVLAVQQVKNTVQLTLENQVEALPDCPPEQLFERFYRGGIIRKQGDMGCGIGLSAAAGIVTLHRGQITVNYPDAHSFRITVLLPCR